MPKLWFYFIALLLPLLFRALLLNTDFVDWLWYDGQTDAYYLLSQLRIAPLFLEFLGNWSLIIFVFIVVSYWMVDNDGEGIPDQFLLLPIMYVPFTIVGDVFLTGGFNAANLYIHPLIVIPAGYLYIFTWVIFIWALEKLRLVL